MTKTKTSRISVREIARAAGYSKSTVGDALKNKTGVNKSTREHILSVAEALGYVPDPRIASWMARVQEAKSKDLLPIAWLNTDPEENCWHKYKFNTPYLIGAQERAMQLGYRLKEMWLHEPEMSMRRMARILRHQGIEGVVVAPSAYHLRLDWEHLAAVSMGGILLAPRLHKIMVDFFYNLVLALKMVKRVGYSRIGICLPEYMDRGMNRSIHAAAHYFHGTTPKLKKVPPLFYHEAIDGDWSVEKGQIIPWLSRHRPDVIVCHNSKMVACLEEAGVRVPEDIGVVHFSTDDDVSDWAGISSNRRDVGDLAVQTVASLMRVRQFGLPQSPGITFIRGTWHPGRTLLIPKPK